MIKKIGWGMNYFLGFILWLVERTITRFGFMVVGLAAWHILTEIARRVFSEQLIGTTHYVLKENRITLGDIVGIIVVLALCMLLIAPITQKLGEVLERIMKWLKKRQRKRLHIDNEKVGKILFINWIVICLVLDCTYLGLLNYAPLYMMIIFALDIMLGWFFFVFTFEMEPEELLDFFWGWARDIDLSGGPSSSGEAYLIIYKK